MKNRNTLGVTRRDRQNNLTQLIREFGADPVIAYVTHDRIGGVLRHVQERMASREKDGFRVITLRPDRNQLGQRLCRIEVSGSKTYMHLKFLLREDIDLLQRVLTKISINSVEFHHFIGHDDLIFELIRSLHVPYDVFIHDYSWFCPRITLTTGNRRYCGEPKVSECSTCIKTYGSNIEEEISPNDLRSRSISFFKSSRSVFVPSMDVKKRIQRQLSISTIVKPWEEPQPLKLDYGSKTNAGKRRICIVGAIGHEKGFDVILGIARLITDNRLPIELAIVGYTCDDRLLLDAGSVTITGAYKRELVVNIIKAQQADWGFLPSIWPETWSYSLSEMWEANLPVIAFDIGTQAERLRSQSGGVLFPIYTPLDRLIHFFLKS